jgi:hypothetical protein
MSALDFPNSPTLNQQYAAPNGVTYQWDGAAWIVTGGPPGQLWTASGTTLLPSDVTKTVSVPGGAAAAGAASVLLGSNPTKGRLQLNNVSPLVASLVLTANRDAVANTQDDATKPSWQLGLNANADAAVVQRQPAGGALATLLTLDSAGNLAVPGQTGGGPAVIVGTATGGGKVRVQINNASAGAIASLSANRDTVAATQDDATRPSWVVQANANADSFIVARQPAAGTYTNELVVSNVGDLTITGSNATKNTGTVWINPSDPRLKQDTAPYAAGLAEICLLEPITYRLKARPETLCYGFDASAVRDVFPECVTETRMQLAPDDAEETDDVLTFDMHPILVALVTAVKDLAAKVAALEAHA